MSKIIDKDMLDSRSNMTNFDYYNSNEYLAYDEGADGSAQKITRRRYKLPQMIVKQWLSNTLAEEPRVYFKNMENDNGDIEDNTSETGEPIGNLIDIRSIMHDLFAYGQVFLLADLDRDGEIVFSVLNKDLNNIKFLEDGKGFLNYIYYETEEKKYNIENDTIETIAHKNIWVYDNETGNVTHKKQTLEGQFEDDVVIMEYEGEDAYKKMPIRFALKSNGLNGKSVFYDAINFIDDFDDTFNETINDKELSKSVLLVPENFVESSLTISDDGEANIDDRYLSGKKYFRIMPGSDQEEIKPIEWRGHWDPEIYIKHLNYLLYMIGLHSGFGEKFFTYDQNGGLKTATEVVNDKDDLYKNKKMYDKSIEEIIKWAYSVFNYLTKSNYVIDKIDFYDGLIIDDNEQRKKYFNDFNADAIDIETYLELTGYKQSDIDKIKTRLFKANKDYGNVDKDNIGFELGGE